MGKFNKGDRVKALVNGIDYKVGDEFVLTADGDGKSVYFDDNAGDDRIRPQEEFELLPVAATGTTESQSAILTIEAGKFYRTRDGRRVGPMEPWPLGGWHADRAPVPLNGGLWNDNGMAWFDNSKDSPDLIAEWVDEPVGQANEKASLFPVTLKLSDGSLTMVVSEFKMPTIKSPSIVARIDNGQPMPAARPLVHDTKEDAEKEAKRLSEKHRGKEFGVFTLIGKHQTEALYDHEWQRLAANGNKIGAIKAIRELTGFGLKAAKDGLEDWLSRNAA